MYKITVIGEKEAIFVSNDTGEQIKKVYDDDQIPDTTKIKTNEWTGYKNSIRSIFKEKGVENRASNSDFDFKQKDAEWLQERKQEQSKTPAIRAKNLSWFNLVRQSVVGDRPASDETIQKVIQIQETFFEQNPLNIICDPLLFKDLFPKGNAPDELLSGIILSAVRKDNEYASKGK